MQPSPTLRKDYKDMMPRTPRDRRIVKRNKKRGDRFRSFQEEMRLLELEDSQEIAEFIAMEDHLFRESRDLQDDFYHFQAECDMERNLRFDTEDWDYDTL